MGKIYEKSPKGRKDSDVIEGWFVAEKPQAPPIVAPEPILPWRAVEIPEPEQQPAQPAPTSITLGTDARVIREYLGDVTLLLLDLEGRSDRSAIYWRKVYEARRAEL